MKNQSPSTQPRFNDERPKSFMQLYWPHLTIFAVIVGIIALIPKAIFHPIRCVAGDVSGSFVSSNGYFIDNQVILRGPSGPIESIKNTFGLNLIEGCDLSYLNTLDNPDPNFTEAERKTFVLQLYQVPATNTVNGVINDIEELAGTSHVHADPNYLVSRSDTQEDPCGRPNSDPGGGGGKDFGDPGGFDPTAYSVVQASNAFTNQWAFGNQGINLPTPSSATGRGVRVAVFDTSPFRVRIPFYRKVGLAFPTPLWFTVRDTPGSYSVTSNHSVFISELIHHMAPGSKIELVHVLDDKGCTRLMPLAKSLEAYIYRRSFWSGNLNKNVLNWSLGIRVPTSPLPSDPSNPPDRDLRTLEDAMNNAYNNGAIIVAAAGNDSNRKTDAGVTGRMDMQIPASYVNVIGVAATDPNGQPSCYSNKGDIAAPGGNGGINPTDPTDLCVPRTDSLITGPNPCTANDMEHCEYGVISIGITDEGPQYMVWSGTSFSTAYVSGLAALLYERRTRDQVKCLITHEASSATTPDPVLGQGLINVTKSLGSTACP